jgi:hypothetical protein
MEEEEGGILELDLDEEEAEVYLRSFWQLQSSTPEISLALNISS